MVLASNDAYGPVFCFWDEPDNFLALSEVGHFVLALRKAFQSGGQFIATSHNPEAIRSFSDENTLVLHRKNHLEPTAYSRLIKFKSAEIWLVLRFEATSSHELQQESATRLGAARRRCQPATARGFHLNVDWDRERQMQVLEVAGGWNRVLNLFESVHIVEMDRCHHRFMVLLIDFDD